jgi:hypothetical protein
MSAPGPTATSTLDAGIQAGSGFTGGAGSAFFNAAVDARNKIFAAQPSPKTGLKEIAGITVADLEAKTAKSFYKNDPTKKSPRQAMSGTAHRALPPVGTPGAGGVGANGRGVGGAQRAKGSFIKVGQTVNANGSSSPAPRWPLTPKPARWKSWVTGTPLIPARTVFKQGTLKEIGSGMRTSDQPGPFHGRCL